LQSSFLIELNTETKQVTSLYFKNNENSFAASLIKKSIADLFNLNLLGSQKEVIWHLCSAV
jgi:hypothetical protein